jgi:hypothetical protein
MNQDPVTWVESFREQEANVHGAANAGHIDFRQLPALVHEFHDPAGDA